MNTKPRGIVSAGHQLTASAGAEALRSGGNAFDAVIAAALMACVAEPLLASLGGGGFLTAGSASGQVQVFDFFGQTPQRQQPRAELFPIEGDFGGTTQEFHIGMGAAATPGMLDGLFAIHRQLGHMPMSELAAPTIAAAKDGVEVNAFQAYIAQILQPIVRQSITLSERFSSTSNNALSVGELQYFPALADCLDTLSREGPDLFYKGEIASRIDQLAREHAGHLRRQDLADYATVLRKPLQGQFANAALFTNPVPSCGGTLIMQSLRLLTLLAPPPDDQAALAPALVTAMAATNLSRHQSGLQLAPSQAKVSALLDDGTLQALLTDLNQRAVASRGTTQISAADQHGNIASMTLSNGEGNGYLIPDTDIHLNNFLGEEDLNPRGIGQWTSDSRMASMMAPTLVQDHPRQRWLALGSGGSNRLRSAIAQVLVNHLFCDQSLPAAIEAPRLHLEHQRLSVEPGLDQATRERLAALPYELEQWDSKNVFFGGVHAVAAGATGLIGYGDSRRGGAVVEA